MCSARVFQPVLLATILTSTVSLSVAGAVTPETIKLYLLGLPAMLIGTWAGLKLYGKLDDALFRKIILVLSARVRRVTCRAVLDVSIGEPCGPYDSGLKDSRGARDGRPALARLASPSTVSFS